VKKTLIVLGVTVLIVAFGFAAVGHQLWFPQEATIGAKIKLEAYLDGDAWTNGTMIDWGSNLNASESYYIPLSVNNTGTLNCTVLFITPDLPVGWLQTWTRNNTFCAIGDSLTGNLTLTTPAIVANGTYAWNSYIKGIPT